MSTALRRCSYCVSSQQSFIYSLSELFSLYPTCGLVSDVRLMDTGSVGYCVRAFLCVLLEIKR